MAGPVQFTLARLPAGRVTIKGEDGKDVEHEVKSIWIGRTEVTWLEYDIFWQALDLPENQRGKAKDDRHQPGTRPGQPYDTPDRGWGHDGFPAGSVPAKWAKAYCAWLSKNTGHKYRLPTEAEWEYACRAGGPPVRPTKDELAKIAWFEGNSEPSDARLGWWTTKHVATRAPNAWGLYDMLGNVAEWVTRDGGRADAVAGGSARDEAEDIHSGARVVEDRSWNRDDPQEPKGTSWYRNGGHVGFRVVRED